MMKSSRLFFVHRLFALIPTTRCFRLKSALLRWCGAEVGCNVRLVSTARFHMTGRLTIGDDTWIGHEVLIVGGNADVLIGKRVDVGPRVMIATGSHELFTEFDRAAGKGYSSPVVIGDGAWLGAASVILGGVTVGACSMVAAGALVNRDVAPSTAVAGIPARAMSQISAEAGK